MSRNRREYLKVFWWTLELKLASMWVWRFLCHVTPSFSPPPPPLQFVDPAYAQERLSLNDDLIMSNYLGGENVTELQYCHTMNSLFKQYSPNSSWLPLASSKMAVILFSFCLFHCRSGVIFTALPEVPTELSMSTEFITKLKLLSCERFYLMHTFGWYPCPPLSSAGTVPIIMARGISQVMVTNF